MKNLIGLLALFCFLSACTGDTSSNQSNGEATTADTTTAIANDAINAEPQPDCAVAGEVLEGNRFWASELSLLVVIKADSTTVDDNLGASHRILEVYSADCELLQREVLPVSVSPDFPYYIAEITYNKVNQMLAIRGTDVIYLYDLQSRDLLPQMEPQFRSERYGVDAQSGMIHHLEVWEDYLIGYSRDYGGFVFDLSDRTQPQPLMPYAEYEEEQQFYPLFLLDSDNGGQQAIMPSFDRNQATFEINALLKAPRPLSKNIPASARDNRFQVLRGTDGERTPIPVDLRRRQVMDLPQEMVGEKTQAILRWMRGEAN